MKRSHRARKAVSTIRQMQRRWQMEAAQEMRPDREQIQPDREQIQPDREQIQPGREQIWPDREQTGCWVILRSLRM